MGPPSVVTQQCSWNGWLVHQLTFWAGYAQLAHILLDALHHRSPTTETDHILSQHAFSSLGLHALIRS